MSSSKAELIARRKAVMPHLRLFYDPEPVHLVKGEGVWLTDSEGVKHLDLYNNVASLGHCHPRIVEALTNQARTLNTHTRYLSSTVVELAERLIESTGEPERLSVVLFVNSGSEANDLAWRMAKVVTGNKGVICSEFAYHGITEACDAFTPATSAVRPPHARYAVPPNPYRFPQVDFMSVMDDPIKKLKEVGLGVAATIFDPTFMSDGILDKMPGYLKVCAEKTHEAGGLYIADEVQAGFGRTGEAMWGYQSHGVKPDFVTLGKPMGNGHPMGCVITTKAILDRFIGGQDKRFFFSTFGGNNVSAAVGLAVLNVVRDEKIIGNARIVGAYLREKLTQLKEKHTCIGQVRGQGLAMGVELVVDRETRVPAGDLASRVVNLASAKILMGREGPGFNVLKIRPPLVITKENVDYAVEQIDLAISVAMKEAKTGHLVRSETITSMGLAHTNTLIK